MFNGIPPTKYPEFKFKPEWYIFVASHADRDGIGVFVRSVAYYGLNEIEPGSELTVEMMDYFNDVVRPELDRQHAKFNRKTKHNGR